MSPNQRKLIFALAVLVLTALACSFSTANIAEAYMAADGDGAQRTTVYSDDQTFYAIVELANAPDTTEVRVVWTAVSAEGEAPNTVIDEVTTTSTDAILTFNLTNEAGFLWPSGDYKADIYLNGELNTTLTFQVQ
ncbi:MAG: hypothetical protein EPO32_09340 [Anaerolineae bacterium]|nr:MAG: hypothetical protein EPO32_09340 [Anaerolineae bacterium]